MIENSFSYNIQLQVGNLGFGEAINNRFHLDDSYTSPVLTPSWCIFSEKNYMPRLLSQPLTISHIITDIILDVENCCYFPVKNLVLP